MILFNKKWLEDQAIVEEAKRWHASGMISNDQLQTIKTHYDTPLYTPTLLIRILLFIFTYIALSGIGGIFLITLEHAGDTALASTAIIVGILFLALLEHIIPDRKLYKSGFEEAVLYMSLWGIIGGFLGLYFEASSRSPHEIIPWIIPIPFLLWGVFRFGNCVATAAVYICILVIVIVTTRMFITINALPFSVMIFSALSYVCARIYKPHPSAQVYQDCLFVIEALSLATFYAGGNYFVVYEGNKLLRLTDFVGNEGSHLLVFIFSTFTLLIPLIYILRGLIIRDHLLLRMGLVTSVLSALTFRYYFHIISPEAALTLSGLTLFLIAVGTTRFLKTERKGFTAKNILVEKSKGANVEGWLIVSTLNTASTTHAKPFEGSGGKFGGGGTGGNW